MNGFAAVPLPLDKRRYILYRNGEEEPYNHQNDPYEWDNLAADEKYAEKKQELRDQMMDIVIKDLKAVEQ